jgi:PBP1b-binding outer membrane lipoprotein LpoB
MNKIGLAVLWLAMLLVGCGGSLRGDANAGPNPGGGFYGAPNINVGRINP